MAKSRARVIAAALVIGCMLAFALAYQGRLMLCLKNRTTSDIQIGDYRSIMQKTWFGNRAGELNGPYLEVWNDGTVKTRGSYLEDKQHRIWTYWKRDGLISEQREYEHDAIVAVLRRASASGLPEGSVPGWWDGERDQK